MAGRRVIPFIVSSLFTLVPAHRLLFRPVRVVPYHSTHHPHTYPYSPSLYKLRYECVPFTNRNWTCLLPHPAADHLLSLCLSVSFFHSAISRWPYASDLAPAVLKVKLILPIPTPQTTISQSIYVSKLYRYPSTHVLVVNVKFIKEPKASCRYYIGMPASLPTLCAPGSLRRFSTWKAGDNAREKFIQF